MKNTQARHEVSKKASVVIIISRHTLMPSFTIVMLGNWQDLEPAARLTMPSLWGRTFTVKLTG